MPTTTLNDQSATGNWANALFTDTFGFSPDFTPDNWDKTGTPIAIGEQIVNDFGRYFDSKLPSAQYRDVLYECARNLTGDAERAIARRDLDQDGISQATELFTFAELGVTSINTTGYKGSIHG